MIYCTHITLQIFNILFPNFVIVNNYVFFLFYQALKPSKWFWAINEMVQTILDRELLDYWKEQVEEATNAAVTRGMIDDKGVVTNKKVQSGMIKPMASNLDINVR